MIFNEDNLNVIDVNGSFEGSIMVKHDTPEFDHLYSLFVNQNDAIELFSSVGYSGRCICYDMRTFVQGADILSSFAFRSVNS